MFDLIKFFLLNFVALSVSGDNNPLYLRQALGFEGSPDISPDSQSAQCGALPAKECDLQATAHNIYGFNLPYLSDAPSSYPKYPSDAWLNPACHIKKCPHAGLRDPLAGLENLSNDQWTIECGTALAAVNCTSVWAATCLPGYFAERRDFMVGTQRYYNTICATPDSYKRQAALGQCYRAIVESSAGSRFKSCSDTVVASIHKASTARGPNPANRWTSGTVMKDHCCQIKQRQSCLIQGNVLDVCGTDSSQAIQELFEEAFVAFNCAGVLTQCP